MPSALHRLHRFFRHEEDDAHGCWNVAAGTLEKRQRLYRVFYQSSTVSIQDEITIDVKAPEGLKDFFTLLVDITGRTGLDPAFQQACADLLHEDPWLSMFEWSTNNLLRPDTGCDDAVSE